MGLRIVNRIVTYDERRQRILLVRNRHARFWYAPGGEWEYGREEIRVGGEREVWEEVGLHVRILRLLYLRTFQPLASRMQLEIFWLARPQSVRIPLGHLDQNGIVEEARWFSRPDLRRQTVFPIELKQRFWIDIKRDVRDPYLRT